MKTLVFFMCKFLWFVIGLSMGRFESGLCLTQNRPTGIGWEKNAPAAYPLE